MAKGMFIIQGNLCSERVRIGRALQSPPMTQEESGPEDPTHGGGRYDEAYHLPHREEPTPRLRRRAAGSWQKPWGVSMEWLVGDSDEVLDPHQRKSERKGAGRKGPAPFLRLHLHKPPAGGLVQTGLLALDFHQVPPSHLPGGGGLAPGSLPAVLHVVHLARGQHDFLRPHAPVDVVVWPPLPRIVSGGRCLSCGHNSSQIRIYVR